MVKTISRLDTTHVCSFTQLFWLYSTSHVFFFVLYNTTLHNTRTSFWPWSSLPLCHKDLFEFCQEIENTCSDFEDWMRDHKFENLRWSEHLYLYIITARHPYRMFENNYQQLNFKYLLERAIDFNQFISLFQLHLIPQYISLQVTK